MTTHFYESKEEDGTESGFYSMSPVEELSGYDATGDAAGVPLLNDMSSLIIMQDGESP